MSASKVTILVVGDGVAALMAALAAADQGARVQLVSEVPQRRAFDVCRSDGIAGVLDGDLTGDSIESHIEDTVRGGDWLAHQGAVRRMCEQAPQLLRLCARMGVLFNRTPEGRMRQVAGGGMARRRVAFTDIATGHELVGALDEQVSREEAAGRIVRTENIRFMGLVKEDHGVCVGIVGADMRTLGVRAYPADAVILCTGGYAGLYGVTTVPSRYAGAVAAQVYCQGAAFANPEFVQFHPAAIIGAGAAHPLSELTCAFGAHLHVPHEGRTWRFIEEAHPVSGGRVPYDIAARAVHKVIFEMKRGVAGESAVLFSCDEEHQPELFRELTHLGAQCRTFADVDMRADAVKVTPAAHYTMGGLWVDTRHMTTIHGLFAAGECAYQYHGANALGANVLLAALHGGMTAGEAAMRYAEGHEGAAAQVGTSVYERATDLHAAELKELMGRSEGENPRVIRGECAALMATHAGIARDNTVLAEADAKIKELSARCAKACLADRSSYANACVFMLHGLTKELTLAELVVHAARARDESRGAHYKTAFPARNDKKWAVITKAMYSPQGPKFDYQEKVDVSEFAPTVRGYE